MPGQDLRPLERAVPEAPGQQVRLLGIAVADHQVEQVAVEVPAVSAERRLDVVGVVVADRAEQAALGVAAVIADVLAVGHPVLVADAFARRRRPDLPGVCRCSSPDPRCGCRPCSTGPRGRR